jgi:hypothetical protein
MTRLTLLIALPLSLLLSGGCRFDAAGLPPSDSASSSDVPAVDAAVDRDANGNVDGDLSIHEAGPPDGPPTERSPDAPKPDTVPPDTVPPDTLAPDTSASPLGAFSAPKAVTQLNTSATEDDPTLTGDMLEIYFERSEQIYFASDRNGNSNIYMAKR